MTNWLGWGGAEPIGIGLHGFGVIGREPRRAPACSTRCRASRHAAGGEWRAVQENALAIDRQLRTLREGLMRVRLVPVGEIFRRMPFVVRDLARETGKKVTLLLQGQATEIDKYLIERMMDPVLHLVRNAVSHGIEPPEERIAAGKRPEGTITLSASAAGEMVTIEIADDGRGVDAAAVAARARAGRPAGAAPARWIPRRCSRCCARPDFRPKTTPTAPAAAASAWRSSRRRSNGCRARWRWRASRGRAPASRFSCR